MWQSRHTGALRVIRPSSIKEWNMDIQDHDQVPGSDDLERKTQELISLMFSLCEEEIRGIVMPDARASSLAHAVMTAQYAIQTFTALARIR
jgi:hypothetical protein